MSDQKTVDVAYNVNEKEASKQAREREREKLSGSEPSVAQESIYFEWHVITIKLSACHRFYLALIKLNSDSLITALQHSIHLCTHVCNYTHAYLLTYDL